MRALVVGAGLVGQAVARALRNAGWSAETLSARDLLDGARPTAGSVELMAFAQGKPVTVRNFRSHFDDLLASRIEPLKAAAALPGVGPTTRALLISSTVAFLQPGGRDLPALQRRFEEAFTALFPDGSILRLGAMRGPNWQIDQGLPGFSRTLLIKRLRLRRPTDIPWADDALLDAAVRAASTAPPGQRVAVAYPRGFDINAFLDSGGPLLFRVPLPDTWFLRVYENLGAPPAFMTISTRHVGESGWASASDTPDQDVEPPYYSLS